MGPSDIQPFLEALNEMGELFADELSELRQRSYWRLLHDTLTLAEWRYACTQAMKRETFHKVPLPAQLMDYVKEYRAAHRTQQPLPQTTAQVLALREALVNRAEVAALIASVWPEDPCEAPPMDAEARKRELRDQARQVGEESWPVELQG